MMSLDNIIKKINIRMAAPQLRKSLSRIEEGEVTMNLPEFEGRFRMSAKSHIFVRLIMHNSFEPATIALAHKYAINHDVIDVGANIGLFSVLFSNNAARSKKRVLSIEPNKQALHYLHENLATNVAQNENVIVYEGIATDNAKSCDFNFIEGMPEYSSTREIVHPEVLHEKISITTVKGDTLDNLVLINDIKPGFIKIDVEGGELEVLNGAVQTIKEYRPVIFLEINDFDSLSVRISLSYSDFFHELKYKILNHELKEAKPPFIGDYICLPNEHIFD